MKKIPNKKITALLALCLTFGMLAGLSGCGGTGTSSRDDGVLTVVTTSFAGFDFARQLTVGAPEGSVKLILLGKTGQDMHDFEPTAADITTLATADVVISVGSENWMDSTLKAAMNENVLRVDMMQACDTMAAVPTEGMDTSAEHDHDHDHGEGICTLIGTDEHVWLSTENAEHIVAAIGGVLEKAAPENATLWKQNTAAYLAELASLTADFAAMRGGAVRDTVLIADRYPFAYLMRQLGLTCHAAFPGCSSETSASFETQTFLIEKAKELSLPYIFIIEGSDGKVAGVVAAESGAEVLTLDSIQVVTNREKTYVGIMRENLEKLKQALY